MIPFDFDYYRPDSIEEAVKAYEDLKKEGKMPLYYGGGTEIITFARRNNINTKAVIDIKGLPECNVLRNEGGKLVIGAALTLTQLSEANVFPLLSKAGGGVADHTARNKITVGGNICGLIIYKEAVLAFLLSDSIVTIASKQGLRSNPINEVFNERLRLNEGEFLVQIATDVAYTNLPYIYIKRTRMGKVGYPLITIAALKVNGALRFAFSGVCAFPFRSLKMEESLNNKGVSLESRVENAINNLPAPIANNVQGSAEYRKFVLKNTLLDVVVKLEGS